MVPDYDHHAELLEINGLVPSSKHSSCRLTHALLSLIIVCSLGASSIKGAAAQVHNKKCENNKELCVRIDNEKQHSSKTHEVCSEVEIYVLKDGAKCSAKMRKTDGEKLPH